MDYESLEKSLKNVKNGKVFCLGHSVLRRKIYGVFFNFGSTHSVLIHGAIHAREHRTSDLVCYLIKQADEQWGRILWEYEGSELAIDVDITAFRKDELPDFPG